MDLLEYFNSCNPNQPSALIVGLEVETDFVMADGSPITADITDALLHPDRDLDVHWERKLELGRQKIELAVAPGLPRITVWHAGKALKELYADAAALGAHPLTHPAIESDEELLLVAEERDEIWVALDSRPALEELCRCSSVQYTVNVTPQNAIEVINCLWAAGVHRWDYTSNGYRWRNYIEQSPAGYRSDRYGGPEGFRDLEDYVAQLKQHLVVMHEGRPCGLPFDEVDDPDIELFLRSVWWHYRLRRYGDQLAVEIRPFARRNDDQIFSTWLKLEELLRQFAPPRPRPERTGDTGFSTSHNPPSYMTREEHAHLWWNHVDGSGM
jgi:hypothetical protein